MQEITSMKINILTLLTGDKYPSYYVDRLYLNLKKHGVFNSDEHNVTFHCYTDTLDTLHTEINVIELNKNLPDEIPNQWYKLDFHSMDEFEDSKCIIMDIDQIPLEGITDIIFNELPKTGDGSHAPDELVKQVEEFDLGYLQLPIAWWTTNPNKCQFQGGFQAFNYGATKPFTDIFRSEPEYWTHKFHEEGKCSKGMGEQNFVSEVFRGVILPLPIGVMGKYVFDNPERIDKLNHTWEKQVLPAFPWDFTSREPLDTTIQYSYSMNNPYVQIIKDTPKFNRQVRIIHFAGAGENPNLMHETEEEWVEKLWKTH